tara:strand:- start:2070 stop:2855 length:786 start_codon:yes stop_codon:yes gene_type:complete
MANMMENFDLGDYLRYNLSNSEEVAHVGELLSCKYIAEWNRPKKLGISVDIIEKTAKDLGFNVISTDRHGGMIDRRTYVVFKTASNEDQSKFNTIINELKIKCLCYKKTFMIVVKDFISMNEIIQQEKLEGIRCLPYKSNKKSVWYPGSQNKENITTYVVCKDKDLHKVQQLMIKKEIPVTVIKNQTVEGQFSLIIGTYIDQVKFIVENWADVFIIIRPANNHLSKQDKFLLDFDKWTENMKNNTDDIEKIEQCLKDCLKI